MLLLIAALLPAALACNNGDKPPADGSDKTPANSELSAYFEAYKAISVDVNGRIQLLNSQFPDAFKGDLDQTKASYAKYVELFDEFIQRFQDIVIPEDVFDLHLETLAANQNLSSINHGRLDELNDATDADQIDPIFADTAELFGAVNAVNQACLKTEEFAAANNIDFDLPCEPAAATPTSPAGATPTPTAGG